MTAEKDAPTNCWSRLLCWLLGHDPCCHLPPESGEGGDQP